MAEMPFYTCHKRVQALEIKSVGNYVPSELPDGGLLRFVEFVDGDIRMLSEKLFIRYTPLPGDFLVRYEDGYESFSPRKAFLEGYTREEAIEALPLRIDQALAAPGYIAIEELQVLLRDCRAEIVRANLRRLRNPLGPDGNVLMERLNDLAEQRDRSIPEPEWLKSPNNYAVEIARVAREAYVTINSLKQQIERLKADTVITRQMAGFKEIGPKSTVAEIEDNAKATVEGWKNAPETDQA